jgi:D-alanyl-lipoteichoic acid acyltransferase DltB (MBOAT superfamily)
MLTFTISGLWHGANWTYVIWGVLNGLFVALERVVPIHRINIKPVRVLYAFAAVTLGWIFFRAKTVHDALLAVKAIPSGLVQLTERIFTGRIFQSDFLSACGVDAIELTIAVAAVVVLELIQTFETNKDMGQLIPPLKSYFRWAAYVCVMLLVVYSWIYFPASKKPFIYFQF